MKKIFTLILFLFGAVVYTNAQGLVINEIDYDQPGADSAEFIELYNSSSNAINLSNYSVILFNGNTSVRYDSIALPNRMLQPSAYFVICAGYAGKVALCDTARTGFTIQNGSPDAVALRDNTTLLIVDAVSYEGNCVPPYIEGTGVPLAESDTLNSGGTGTPNNFLSISRYPDGMDSNNDSVDFHRYCSTPGMANVNISTGCGPVTVKTIVVNASFELYPNPSKGIVTIEYNNSLMKNSIIILSDLLGNEIRKVSLKNSTGNNYQLDISEFQDGIYFMKMKYDSGEMVKRIILKK